MSILTTNIQTEMTEVRGQYYLVVERPMDNPKDNKPSSFSIDQLYYNAYEDGTKEEVMPLRISNGVGVVKMPDFGHMVIKGYDGDGCPMYEYRWVWVDGTPTFVDVSADADMEGWSKYMPEKDHAWFNYNLQQVKTAFIND